MVDKYYAGADLGGTRLKVAVANQDGRIVAEQSGDTHSEEGPDGVLKRIADLTRETVAKAGVDVEALGVGIPGTLDMPNGITLHVPNFPGHWPNVPVRDKMAALIDWPVYILNDVRCATLGELEFGLGRSAETMVFMAMGTGLGGGIAVEGRLRLGKLGSAGELGHIVVEPHGGLPCGCGKHGCLETIVGGPALIGECVRLVLTGLAPNLYRISKGELSNVDAYTIEDAAKAGDEHVWDAIYRVGWYVGVAMADLTVSIHPDLFVIGGGISNVGEPLFQAMREGLRENVGMFDTDDIRIEKSAVGGHAGVLGAVALAKGEGLLDHF